MENMAGNGNESVVKLEMKKQLSVSDVHKIRVFASFTISTRNLQRNESAIADIYCGFPLHTPSLLGMSYNFAPNAYITCK